MRENYSKKCQLIQSIISIWRLFKYNFHDYQSQTITIYDLTDTIFVAPWWGDRWQVPLSSQSAHLGPPPSWWHSAGLRSVLCCWFWTRTFHFFNKGHYDKHLLGDNNEVQLHLFIWCFCPPLVTYCNQPEGGDEGHCILNPQSGLPLKD